MSSPDQSSYRPDLDGLRCIAILLVLFFHARVGFSGGYVGVDVFFVISGFLITRLILKERQKSDSFSMTRFLTRRVARLLPALTVMFLFTAAVGWMTLLPEDLAELGKALTSQCLFLSNVFHWTAVGYFRGPAEIKPLLHSWSLAVEEQFYLIFPLLLGIRLGGLNPTRLIIGLGIVSFGLSCYGTEHFQSAAFYLLPTRAWELLIGALLASSEATQAPVRYREALSVLGLLLILASATLYSNQTPFPGLAALPPCLGCCLLILSQGSRCNRVLAHPLFTSCGLISYSLYLWHWPIFAFSHYIDDSEQSLALKLGLCGASILAAALSYKLVESPTRKYLSSEPRKAGLFALASVALGCSVGLTYFFTQGLPNRVPQSAAKYSQARKYFDEARISNLKRVTQNKLYHFGDDKAPVQVLLWGDSFAASICPTFEELSKTSSFQGELAACGGTPPLLGFTKTGEVGLHNKAPEYNSAVLELIKQKSIKRVVLVARWSAYDPQAVQAGLVPTLEAL